VVENDVNLLQYHNIISDIIGLVYLLECFPYVDNVLQFVYVVFRLCCIKVKLVVQNNSDSDLSVLVDTSKAQQRSVCILLDEELYVQIRNKTSIYHIISPTGA